MPGSADSKGAEQPVLVGRVGAAHGIKGEVRIQSFCANPLDIAAYGPLHTSRFGDLTIAAARLQKTLVIARIKGIADRSAAEKLNGAELFIARDRLPPQDDEDDFYIADLIGLEARLPNGKTYGTVRHVADFGAGDILEIDLVSGGTAMLAFTKAVVPEVAVEHGYLVVDPPVEVEATDPAHKEPK